MANHDELLDVLLSSPTVRSMTIEQFARKVLGASPKHVNGTSKNSPALEDIESLLKKGPKEGLRRDDLRKLLHGDPGAAIQQGLLMGRLKKKGQRRQTYYSIA